MRKQFTEFTESLVLSLKETDKLAKIQLVRTFYKIPGLSKDF